MWKLQGGSYIPGFSGQAYGAGLQRDVTKTRQDQARKAAELEKYQSKRSSLGKWAGNIVGAGVGVGLGAMGMGPLGLTIGKTLGAGLGSRLGSSKMISGEGPSMSPGAGTGLLGSTYEQLGEAKGGIDEAMRGQAYGAGAAQLMSGLTGAAGDKLGAAFGKTGLGMNLKSGYGKMMAEKFGKNIGQALPGAEQVTDLTGTGLGRGFDFGDMPGQLTEDRSWFDKAVGAMQRQQGGYMQGYQEGGEADGGILSKLNQLSDMKTFYEGEGPRTESGDLKFGPKGMITREGLAERYNFPLEEAVFDTSYGEPGSGNMAIDISIPSNDQLIKYQRSGNMPGKKAEFMSKSAEAEQAMRKAFPDEYQSLATDIGFGDYSGAAEKVGSGWLDMSPLERMRSKTSSLGSKKNIPSESDEKKQMMMKALGMEESEYDSFMKWKKSKGMQMGGMMPGGVSNALPYQEGGEAQTKSKTIRGSSPVEYSYDDPDVLKLLMSVPASQVGEGEGLRYYLGEKPHGRMPNLDRQMAQLDARQKMAFAPQDSIPSHMVENYFDKPSKLKGLKSLLGIGKQQGGSISPYNLGGSVTQQPMAYQLGGLLKYKRSPMMG